MLAIGAYQRDTDAAMKNILHDMAQMGDYATLASGRVRYQDAGPKDAETVLLVHGLIGHMHIWDRNYDALVDAGYRVVRLDLYGRGFSDRVTHTHDAQLYVGQVAGLLDHLGIDRKVHLMGLSMGGAVITRFATTFPHRVASMLWVDCYGIPTPNEPLMRITRPPYLGEALIGTLGGPLLRQAPHRGVYDRAKHRDFNRWFSAPLSIKGSKRSLLSTLRHFMLEDHAAHFTTVNSMDVPKLLVWGKHDAVLPLAYGERVRQLVPSARFELFEHSGHLPHFEEPERFNQLALAFLARL